MKHLLYAYPTMSLLAERIVKVNKKTFEEPLSERDRVTAELFRQFPQLRVVYGDPRPEVILGTIDWKRFPDTFPNTFIRDVEAIKNGDVSFLADFSKPSAIFEQYSLLMTMVQLGPKKLRIILPYFPTGTMERIDHEGQVATAAALMQLLCSLRVSGISIELVIHDIHALGIRHYSDLGSALIPRFKTGLKLLKEQLATMENVAIAFPDEGAYKRFKTFFLKENDEVEYPFIICAKKRKGVKRSIVIHEGDPRGKNVCVIDDLFHSGGTLAVADALLAEAGASSVSNYCTHGVAELDAWKNFLDIGLAHFWITDSCPDTAAAVEGQGPFTVLSLDRSLYNAIVG